MNRHIKNLNSTVIWNMSASILMAFQSVIILMVLTRVLGVEEAGVFTLAYATTNLFLTIGKFGMRVFQASDVNCQYTFSEYFLSRIITTIFMLILILIYTYIMYLGHGYSVEKCKILWWMAILKSVDSIEDIYIGGYQQKGKLLYGVKAMSFRLVCTIAIYCISIIYYQNQLVALKISFITTLLIFIMCILKNKEYIGKVSLLAINSKIINLLKGCFPLFLGSFLIFYIGNVPKYAIDSVLDDIAQACYGFIAMPVFIIGLLNGFIFNPILHKISKLWTDGKIIEFNQSIKKQQSIVVIITIICMISAHIIGPEVLSLIYGVDLKAYRVELVTLLLGGGILGSIGVTTSALTIMRRQKDLLKGYIITSIFATVTANIFVSYYGIMGASVVYLLCMLLLCFFFNKCYYQSLQK